MEKAPAWRQRKQGGKKSFQQADKRHGRLIHLLPAQVHLLALHCGTAKRQFKNETHKNLQDPWNARTWA